MLRYLKEFFRDRALSPTAILWYVSHITNPKANEWSFPVIDPSQFMVTSKIIV
jgi:hypothetical protein